VSPTLHPLGRIQDHRFARRQPVLHFNLIQAFRAKDDGAHDGQAVGHHEHDFLPAALGNGPLGPETMEHVTRRIVDRILQAPSEALRRGDLLLDPQGAANLRALLGLDEPEPAEARDENS